MGKIAVVTEKFGINVKNGYLLNEWRVLGTVRTVLDDIEITQLQLFCQISSKAFQHRLARLPLY